MSILGTFAILFEADSKPLQAGIDDAGKKAKDLEANLSGVDKATSMAGEKMLSLAKGFGAVAASFVSIAAAKAALNTFTEGADSIGKFTSAIGINIEEVGAWGAAVQGAGGSQEAFQGTIKGLHQQLYQIKRFGWSELGQDLSMLGIKAKDSSGKVKEATAILPELAAKFEKMSAMRSLEVGGKLGLDEGTIQLLRKGKDGVEQLIEKQRQLGVYTKQDAETARAYKSAVSDMGRAWDGFSAILARAVLPALEWVSARMTEFVAFLKNHENLAKAFGIGVAAAITAIGVAALWALAPILALAAPFILIGLAVAGVAILVSALYDDIMAFANGGASVIGFLKTSFEKFLDSTQSNIFMKALQGILKVLIAMGKAAWDLAELIFKIVSAPFGVVADFLGSMFGSDKKKAPGNPTENSLTGKAPGNLKQEVETNLNLANKQLALTNTPLAAQTSSSILNSTSQKKTTVLNIAKVEVATQATDADGVAKQLGASLNDQMMQAMNGMSSGVAM